MMKNKKSIITLIILSILAIACGPSKQELAQKLLTEAGEAMSTNDYNSARLKVDSINLLYPEQIEEIAAGQKMMLQIELTQLQQSLTYYDTLLIKRNDESETLKKNFVFQSGKFEGYVGTYIHKRQQVGNSHDRSYVRAYLDEKGEFYISSRYHGKSHISHNSIKVYDAGLFAETEKIAESSFDNRAFDDGEDCWETVNYRNGTDNGVVSFIVNNYDKTLKAQFIGKKHYYIVLESYDKEAIRDAYNLSLIIKEINELTKNKAEAEKRISTLKNQLK